VAYIIKATDERSAGRAPRREGDEVFANSPREKVDLVLDYRDRVWRTNDVELDWSGNVHQNGLESEKSFFSGRLSVHDHRKGDGVDRLLG